MAGSREGGSTLKRQRLDSSAAPLLLEPSPLDRTGDSHVRAVLAHDFFSFESWRTDTLHGRSVYARMRVALDHLLPRLLGARDYSGAAQVLAVIYRRFALMPAQCVQSSLEILRRHPQVPKEELLALYDAALSTGQLDKVMLLKEVFLVHISSGDFYEAHSFFKERIQHRDIQHDVQLLGTFGILCYWLLFIESPELRDAFGAESTTGDNFTEEYEDEASITRQNGWEQDAMMARYQFKTPIGVHLLYQDATSALQRAISLCPESAVYVSHYVQLLTMAGDVTNACDVLENLFHRNPSNPHAAKMLAEYLERYFPESSDAQAGVYTLLLESDPANRQALDKFIEFYSAGIIPIDTVLRSLASVVDAVGSDMFAWDEKHTAPAAWEQLALGVFSVVESDDTNGDDVTTGREAIEELRSTRRWWLDSFFARPQLVDEVIQLAKLHPHLRETLVYKAVVAHYLFQDSGGSAIALALDGAMGRSVADDESTSEIRTRSSLSRPKATLFETTHIRLFKRLLPAIDSTVKKPRVWSSSSCQRSTVSSYGIHVVGRTSLLKRSRHANPPKLELSLLACGDSCQHQVHVIDHQLVTALEDAIRDGIDLGCHGDLQDKAFMPKPKRSRTKAVVKCGALIKQPNTPSKYELPLYATLIEELLYESVLEGCEHLTYRHIYTQLRALLRGTDVELPTFHEAREVVRLFETRWVRSIMVSGRPGLLLRYEVFLTALMRRHFRPANCWRGGPIALGFVHHALHEMKLHVTRSHIHFPSVEEAMLLMHRKRVALAKLRRRLIRKYTAAMRVLAFSVNFMPTHVLVETAFDVVRANGHHDLVGYDDLWRWAETILAQRYGHIVVLIPTFEFHWLWEYAAEGDPELALRRLRRFQYKSKLEQGELTLPMVRALVWLKFWEARQPHRYPEVVRGTRYREEILNPLEEMEFRPRRP
ncbi:hypothetical protein PINS_up006181 [Pythium insidiosum]|nr:hypothetical protein PINS_up006181 [Pythium insidiosum]